MPVTPAMTEHSAKRHHEEEGQEQKVTSADEKHERGEQQPVDGEAHQSSCLVGLCSSLRGNGPIWHVGPSLRLLCPAEG
jgi:hypothetical protein